VVVTRPASDPARRGRARLAVAAPHPAPVRDPLRHRLCRRDRWLRGPAAPGHLHELGWTHSVEAWDEEGLAGGLYGVAIGGLFAAESMFHVRTDASKAALAGLCERLGPGALLDVQWLTPHLESLGAIEIARDEYLQRLARVVTSA
jgi:leucyl/phenylalanyl-tRNA--protein transferase